MGFSQSYFMEQAGLKGAYYDPQSLSWRAANGDALPYYKQIVLDTQREFLINQGNTNPTMNDVFNSLSFPNQLNQMAIMAGDDPTLQKEAFIKNASYKVMTMVPGMLAFTGFMGGAKLLAGGIEAGAGALYAPIEGTAALSTSVNMTNFILGADLQYHFGQEVSGYLNVLRDPTSTSADRIIAGSNLLGTIGGVSVANYSSARWDWMPKEKGAAAPLSLLDTFSHEAKGMLVTGAAMLTGQLLLGDVGSVMGFGVGFGFQNKAMVGPALNQILDLNTYTGQTVGNIAIQTALGVRSDQISVESPSAFQSFLGAREPTSADISNIALSVREAIANDPNALNNLLDPIAQRGSASDLQLLGRLAAGNPIELENGIKMNVIPDVLQRAANNVLVGQNIQAGNLSFEQLASLRTGDTVELKDGIKLVGDKISADALADVQAQMVIENNGMRTARDVVIGSLSDVLMNGRVVEVDSSLQKAMAFEFVRQNAFHPSEIVSLLSSPDAQTSRLIADAVVANKASLNGDLVNEANAIRLGIPVHQGNTVAEGTPTAVEMHPDGTATMSPLQSSGHFATILESLPGRIIGNVLSSLGVGSERAPTLVEGQHANTVFETAQQRASTAHADQMIEEAVVNPHNTVVEAREDIRTLDQCSPCESSASSPDLARLAAANRADAVLKLPEVQDVLQSGKPEVAQVDAVASAAHIEAARIEPITKLSNAHLEINTAAEVQGWQDVASHNSAPVAEVLNEVAGRVIKETQVARPFADLSAARDALALSPSESVLSIKEGSIGSTVLETVGSSLSAGAEKAIDVIESIVQEVTPSFSSLADQGSHSSPSEILVHENKGADADTSKDQSAGIKEEILKTLEEAIPTVLLPESGSSDVIDSPAEARSFTDMGRTLLSTFSNAFVDRVSEMNGVQKVAPSESTVFGQLYSRNTAAVEAMKIENRVVEQAIKAAKAGEKPTVQIQDRSYALTDKASIAKVEEILRGRVEATKRGTSANFDSKSASANADSVSKARGVQSLEKAQAELGKSKDTVLDQRMGDILKPEIEMVKAVKEGGVNADQIIDIRKRSNEAADAFKAHVVETYGESYKTLMGEMKEANGGASSADLLNDTAKRTEFVRKLFKLDSSRPLTESEALAYVHLIAMDPQIGESGSGLLSSQTRMTLEILHSNIALLAAGAGKTYPYVSAMTMRSVMGVDVRGRIIVASSQEAPKFLGEGKTSDGREVSKNYRNILRAGGLDVTDGIKAFKAGKPEDGSAGDNYQGFTKQLQASHSVQIVDVDSFGHSLRVLKEAGRDEMAAAAARLNTTFIDEADKPSTSTSEFSVGREAPVDPLFREHVIDLKLRLSDLATLSKGDSLRFYTESQFEKAGGMTGDFLGYTEDGKGRIIYTDALRNQIVGQQSVLRAYIDGDLGNALRAIRAVDTGNVYSLDGGVHQADAAELHYQTKDQNPVYSVMAEYAVMAKRMTESSLGRVDAADLRAKDVKIMTHGEQATLGEGFTLKNILDAVINNQGSAKNLEEEQVVGAGTGTGKGVEFLMENAFGKGVTVPLEDIQFSDILHPDNPLSTYSHHLTITDPVTNAKSILTFVFDRAQDSESAPKTGTYRLMTQDQFMSHLIEQAGTRGFVYITSDVRGRVEDYFRNEIASRVRVQVEGDPSIEAQSKEAAIKIQIESEMTKWDEISKEAKLVDRVVSRFYAKDIEAVKAGNSLMDLAASSNSSLIRDIASQLDVIDKFSDPAKREAIAGAVSGERRDPVTGEVEKGPGRRLIGSITMGRALDMSGENNYYIEDAHTYDMGTRTQADSRVGRTLKSDPTKRATTDRNASLDMTEVGETAERYRDMKKFLDDNAGDPALQSISRDMALVGDLPGLHQQATDLISNIMAKLVNGEAVEKESMELRQVMERLDTANADFKLLETRDKASDFRIGSESRTKLVSEAIGQEIANAPRGSKDPDAYKQAELKFKQGGYDTSRNTLLKDYRSPVEIGTEQLRSSLQQAEAMWTELSKNESLSQPARDRAALRALDIKETLTVLPELVKDAMAQRGGLTFAEIDTRNLNISRQVVRAAAGLINQMLPSKSLSVSTQDTRVLAAVQRVALTMAQDGEGAVSDGSVQNVSKMAQEALVQDPRLRTSNPVISDLASTNNPDILRALIKQMTSLNVTVQIPSALQSFVNGQTQVTVSVVGQLTDNAIQSQFLRQYGHITELADYVRNSTLVRSVEGVTFNFDATGANTLSWENSTYHSGTNGITLASARTPTQILQGTMFSAGQTARTLLFDRNQARAMGMGQIGSVGYSLSRALPNSQLNLNGTQQISLAAHRFAETGNTLMLTALENYARRNGAAVTAVLGSSDMSTLLGKANTLGSAQKQHIEQELKRILSVAATAPEKYSSVGGFTVRRAIQDNEAVVTFDPRSDTHFEKAVTMIDHSLRTASDGKVTIFFNPVSEARQSKQRMGALQKAIQQANDNGASIFLVGSDGVGHKLTSKGLAESQRMPIITVSLATQASTAIKNLMNKDNQAAPFDVARIIELQAKQQNLIGSLSQQSKEKVDFKEIQRQYSELQAQINGLLSKVWALAPSYARSYSLLHPSVDGHEDPVQIMLDDMAQVKSPEGIMKAINEFIRPPLSTRQQRRVADSVGMPVGAAKGKLNIPLHFINVQTAGTKVSLDKVPKFHQPIVVVPDQATASRTKAKAPIITSEVFQRYQTGLNELNEKAKVERISSLPNSWESGLMPAPATQEKSLPILTTGRISIVGGLMLGSAAVAYILGAPITLTVSALAGGFLIMGSTLMYKGGFEDILPLLNSSSLDEITPAHQTSAPSVDAAVAALMPRSDNVAEMPMKKPGIATRNHRVISRVAAAFGAIVFVAAAKGQGMGPVVEGTQSLDMSYAIVAVAMAIGGYIFRQPIISAAKKAVNYQTQLLVNA